MTVSAKAIELIITMSKDRYFILFSCKCVT
jgi:hypothetical protein